jgi:hypothetical protein
MTDPHSSGEGSPSHQKPQAAHDALDDCDHHVAVDAGVNDVARAGEDVGRLHAVERERVAQRLHDALAVAKQVKHREDDEQDLHRRHEDVADDHARPGRQRDADGLQRLLDGVAQPFLR